MTAIEYIFVPNDGTFERPLSPSEATSQKFTDDDVRQTRFSDLLGTRGVDVPFWLCESGVLIKGTREQARGVSRLVEELPNLVPSTAMLRENKADDAPHIASTFDGAASRFQNVPVMRQNFINAASEARVVPFGSKASIRGSHSTRQMAA